MSTTQELVLRRCRLGENIHLERREDGAYYFWSCGKTVNKRTVEALLSGGFIVAMEDGLFDGDAQTLTATKEE